MSTPIIARAELCSKLFGQLIRQIEDHPNNPYVLGHRWMDESHRFNIWKENTDNDNDKKKYRDLASDLRYSDHIDQAQIGLLEYMSYTLKRAMTCVQECTGPKLEIKEIDAMDQLKCVYLAMQTTTEALWIIKRFHVVTLQDAFKKY